MFVFYYSPLVTLVTMLIIPISLYINSVHLLQYLFPDAGVEKSSENDKTKAAHSNASVTAAQQGNSDDVCVRFFYDHMNIKILACGDSSESMTEVTKSNFTLVCVHQSNVRNNADNFILFSLFISHTLSLVKVILSKH